MFGGRREETRAEPDLESCKRSPSSLAIPPHPTPPLSFHKSLLLHNMPESVEDQPGDVRSRLLSPPSYLNVS